MWKNPNPQNNFEAQTISLSKNINNYKYAIVGVAPSSTRAPMNNIVVPNIECCLTTNIESFRTRTVTLKNNTAIFGDGYFTNSYNTNQAVNNTVCIPQYIYGI